MVFNRDFNLGFGLPRSDTCANCEKLNLIIKSDPNDMGARQQLADHQEMADKGYQTMRGDRKAAFLKNDSDFAQIEKRKASAKVFVPSDWFSVVREASRRSPYEVVAMQQEDFKNYKDFVRSRYTNRRFSSGGSVFHDVHWLNFGWGKEVNPVSGKVTLLHIL